MSRLGLVCFWRGAANFERGLWRGVARQVGDEAKCASVILKGQAGLLIAAFEFAPLSRDVRDAGVTVDRLRAAGFCEWNIQSGGHEQDENHDNEKFQCDEFHRDGLL